jgi:glycosyltransferase involved in cell wall biosynthesis
MEFPLFSSAPKRITLTSAWHQHIPFAMHLVELLKPAVIVELGTHKGDSYCAFCQSVQELQLPTHCYAVDTWKGDEQAGFFGPELYEELRNYHDSLYGSFSKLMQCSFDEALPYFTDETIDLLHIDGCHSYEMVKHDLYSWRSKMSRRGIVLLHDTNERERNFGVWRLWDEVKRDYPHFEFLHSHGLGVLGVGENISAPVRDLFQASESEIFRIRNFFFHLGERISLHAAAEAEVEHLRSIITEKDRTIQIINDQKEQAIQKLAAQIQRPSNKWELIRYYSMVRDNVLPRGTKRRKMAAFIRRSIIVPYQLTSNRLVPNIKKFLWYCHIYGFFNAVKLSKQKLRQPIVLDLQIKPLCISDALAFVQEEELPLIDKKVSVVIPTKNAGADFPFLLKKLKSQKGLREQEIIVVDSGSTDQTLDAARDEKVKIIPIHPEDFNHAYARNLGAECATGDYILFLVQDALPMTDNWLWEMTRALEQNNTVAVSCAEYPRSDSDLFYQHLLWNHYRTLNLDRDRFLSWDESCSTQLGLRSNSQISDIATLIRSDIFNKYKYKTKFAEDLDLGIRLIKDRHKIGFLYSTRVLHSHNRPAFYFLKRAYVDSKFLSEAFPDIQFPAIRNQKHLFRDIAAIYYRTKNVAPEIINATGTEEVGLFFQRIKSLYYIEQNETKALETAVPENEFEDFVRSLALSIGDNDIRYKSKDNILLPHFLKHLDIIQSFISESRRNIDATLIGDLVNMLTKILALHAGSHIAYLYLTLSEQKRQNTFWTALDKQLTSGI